MQSKPQNTADQANAALVSLHPHHESLDMSSLTALAEELLGQTHGVSERICTAVAQLSQQRARLIFPELDAKRKRIVRQREYPIAVQFGGREYGMLCIAPSATQIGQPALQIASAHRLARACGGVLYLLEYAAFFAGLTQLLPSEPGEPLTCRERDVLIHMAQRATQEEIATKLCISAATVGKHQERIYTKLGVHSGFDAVLAAHQAGLIPVIPLATAHGESEHLLQEDA